jgi:CheY-like chemotaxis protein
LTSPAGQGRAEDPAISSARLPAQYRRRAGRADVTPASCNVEGPARWQTDLVMLRCVIVDDDALFLKAAQTLLESDGVTVAGVASTGADAVERVGVLRPDVVLIDIRLGQESGFDVARQLAANGQGAALIMISTHARLARRAVHAGRPDVALDLLLAASLRCWWVDTGPEARQMVAAVTGQITGMPADPRYVAALAIAEPVACSQVVDALLSQAGPGTDDVEALILLGMAAYAIGDPVRSLRVLDRAEAGLRQRGQLGRLSHVLNLGLLSRLELGDFQRARMDSEEARRLAVDTQQPIWHSGALALDAMEHGLRGDNLRAQQLAADAEQLAAGSGLRPAGRR